MSTFFDAQPNAAMEFTGERMVPENADAKTFWEHIYRYRFAAKFVRNKAVLDIACGEGYGSAALLKAGAASLIGVDISEETCAYARSKYGIDARVGSAERIPLADASVDVIVSFETIEHVERPEEFVAECARVLVPGGRIIISTPNRDIYRLNGVQHNPFHCSEMSEDEFLALLHQHFVRPLTFVQCLRRVNRLSWRFLILDGFPWAGMPGRSRLRRFLRAKLCPHIEEGMADQYRNSVVETALVKDPLLSGCVNPLLVQRKIPWEKGEAEYLVVVAKKPRVPVKGQNRHGKS